MTNASVPPDHIWGLLLYSVRYATGRSSYAVGEVCDWVRAYRRFLTEDQIKQIADEVEAELRRCDVLGTKLGMDYDHKTWQKLIEDLRA